MSIKVKDLSVEQLQSIITQTVQGAMDEILEDFAALSSDNFINSIETARKEYKAGKIKSLEDVIDL